MICGLIWISKNRTYIKKANMEILAFFFLKWIKVILMAFYSVIGSLDLYIRLSFNTSKTQGIA